MKINRRFTKSGVDVFPHQVEQADSADHAHGWLDRV